MDNISHGFIGSICSTSVHEIVGVKVDLGSRYPKLEGWIHIYLLCSHRLSCLLPAEEQTNSRVSGAGRCSAIGGANLSGELINYTPGIEEDPGIMEKY